SKCSQRLVPSTMVVTFVTTSVSFLTQVPSDPSPQETEEVARTTSATVLTFAKAARSGRSAQTTVLQKTKNIRKVNVRRISVPPQFVGHTKPFDHEPRVLHSRQRRQSTCDSVPAPAGCLREPPCPSQAVQLQV